MTRFEAGVFKTSTLGNKLLMMILNNDMPMKKMMQISCFGKTGATMMMKVSVQQTYGCIFLVHMNVGEILLRM